MLVKYLSLIKPQVQKIELISPEAEKLLESIFTGQPGEAK
jgi:hypothetical protein